MQGEMFAWAWVMHASMVSQLHQCLDMKVGDFSFQISIMQFFLGEGSVVATPE
jgi:hypothetical protein